MNCEASLCRILRPGIRTPGTPTVKSDGKATPQVHPPKRKLAAKKPKRTEFLSPLTYSIDTIGQGGGFYFRTSMPLNRILVNRVTWVAHFTRDGQDGEVQAVL